MDFPENERLSKFFALYKLMYGYKKYAAIIIEMEIKIMEDFFNPIVLVRGCCSDRYELLYFQIH